MTLAKTCSCGRAYSVADWISLPEPARGGELVCEVGPLRYVEVWRNCPCRSTGMIELSLDGRVISSEELDAAYAAERGAA